MRGPEIRAGEPRRLRWDTVFLTPFDAYYDVVVLVGYYGKVVDDLAYGGYRGLWNVWTVNQIC